jgi:hypothetical protein
MKPCAVSVGSYDDHQVRAILVRCLRCEQLWFMTVPWFICSECR